MGGIHAIEHAAIGMFPLLVMADRNDLGGISTPFHPQVGSSAVFILTGFRETRALPVRHLNRLRTSCRNIKAIGNCPCENGCP